MNDDASKFYRTIKNPLLRVGWFWLLQKSENQHHYGVGLQNRYAK